MFRAAFVRALVLFAVCAPWFNIVRDNADSAGMLAHLHGLFVGFDLLYDDEYRALQVTPTFAFVTAEGVVSNHWPVGASWLQVPGYGLGLLAARVLDGVGPRFSPYGGVVLLAVRSFAMLVFAGVLRALVRAYAEAGGTRAVGALAAVTWALGTPLLYYASEAPLRPHLWGFAVMVAFVLAWRDRSWGTPRTRAVLLGGLVGLAVGIRPQLAPAWLLVAEDAWSVRQGRGARLGLAALSAAAWPLLHLRVQLWMYGGALGDYATETKHHVRAFLFSPYHGALVWSPVLLLGGCALVWAIGRHERAAWLLAALVLHQIWLDAGMRDISVFAVLGTRTWSGGTSFGARKLLDALPLLLPSSLALVAHVRASPSGARALAATALALVVPSVLLLAAAFVDPGTTAALLDWRGLTVVLERPLSFAAWGDAVQARAVPPKVWLAVAGVVVVPLVAAAGRTDAVLQRASTHARVGLASLCVLGGAAVAHVHLGVVMVRSDSTLIADPQRMAVARAWMHPAHEAAVARIPARHATLRALLGEHAAPPTAGPRAASAPGDPPSAERGAP